MNDADIEFEYSHNEGIRFEGDIESLRLITKGFWDRMAALQPPAEPSDLRIVHNLAMSVVQAEIEWVNAYDSAIRSGDSAHIRTLEETYLYQLPMAELDQITNSIERMLAVQNIPHSTVRYDDSEFRLTVLDEDYVRVVSN